MSASTWPGKPGEPLNPEKDGWHVLRHIGGRISCWEWEAEQGGPGLGGWNEDGGDGDPESFARQFTYVSPVRTDADVAAAQARAERAERENARLSGLLNTPELHDFAKAVVLEAAHQRERWGNSHDAGKAPEDWFWLLGYLGGKALHAAKAGDTDKALHHAISTAAALANWHAALLGSNQDMRPGIGPGSASFPAAEAALGAGGEA